LCSSSQNINELKTLLLKKSNIIKDSFEISLENIDELNLHLYKSNSEFEEWLLKKEPEIRETKNDFFKVHFYINLAKCMSTNELVDSSYRFIDTIFTFFNADEFPRAFLKINWLGSKIASNAGNYSISNQYLNQILQSNLFNKDSLVLAEAMVMLANNYLLLHCYETSYLYCQKAYPICQKLESSQCLAKILFLMYNNSYYSKSDTSYFDYLNRARELAFKSGDSTVISSYYSNLGLANQRAGEYTRAIENYIKSRSYISEKGGLADLNTSFYQHLSYMYMPDSTGKAWLLSKYILNHAKKNNYFAMLSNAYLTGAHSFARFGNVDSTEYYLDLSENFRNKYGNPNISPNYYYEMYKVSMAIANEHKAIGYLNKSLTGFQNIYRMNNGVGHSSRFQLDLQMQKDNIKELQIANKLEKTRSNRQRKMIYLISLIFVIGSVTYFFVRNQYQKLLAAYQELFKKNINLSLLEKEIVNPEKFQITRNVGLSFKDEEELYHKIIELFEVNKIYLNENISISWLSEELNTNTSYLSSVINNRFEMSFKTLLNKYRINEARKLLVSKNYSCYSIEGIANEVGYHSRSTFYQVFRQLTGVTPTIYVKNHFKQRKRIEIKKVEFHFENITMN
jgi:AraC-like DNA-binding protein